MLHHKRWIYRYDVEGSQSLGLITVQRTRFTNKFKTATYQHKYMYKATRLSLGEYLMIRRVETYADAVQLLSRARGVHWCDLMNSQPSPDASPDHSFAWLIGSIGLILAVWIGAASAAAYVITKVAG